MSSMWLQITLLASPGAGADGLPAANSILHPQWRTITLQFYTHSRIWSFWVCPSHFSEDFGNEVVRYNSPQSPQRSPSVMQTIHVSWVSTIHLLRGDGQPVWPADRFVYSVSRKHIKTALAICSRVVPLPGQHPSVHRYV